MCMQQGETGHDTFFFSVPSSQVLQSRARNSFQYIISLAVIIYIYESQDPRSIFQKEKGGGGGGQE